MPGCAFPEGVATAEVLKVGASSDAGTGGRVRLLLGAAALSGGFKFAEGGLKLWSESLEGAFPARAVDRFMEG
jgi:uncharacterized oligopeptide transporter (OPT) family protein